MFARETCQHCPVCNTVTPHSRQRLHPALCIASVFALLAGAMFIVSPAEIIAGLVCAFIAIAIVAFQRERLWRIHCDRCRGKAVREIEKTKPGRNTEIVL